MKTESPEAQLSGFIAKYRPEIGKLAREILAKMRSRLPGAVQFVYDNYNALVIGFGPNERPSDAIFSVALYPKWVNLFFLFGAYLPDPEQVFSGSGKQVRYIRLESANDLDKPTIRDLMTKALETADPPIDSTRPGRLLIRAVAAKQRPRR